jgi:Ca2+-binding RTX toxin-like protein
VEAVVGGEAADTLIGDDGPNRLAGGAGGDRIDGGGGADRIEGGDGDDALDGGSGADDVAGGAGVDGTSYGSRSDGVAVSLDGLANDGNAEDLFADNLRADVENVTGTGHDDVLRGSAADNLLDGLFGDNRLEGLGGNDTLTASNRGSDVLDGGDGIDTASYRDTGFDGVTVTLDGRANDGAPAGAAGVPAGGEADNVLTENVTGSEFDDVITGNDESNRLSGGGGDDTLRGAGAGDAILGGPGLDTLLGESGVDVVNANDGVHDQVDCGPDPDVANLDLTDAAGVLRGGGTLPATAGCETQNTAPRGQLPNVRLASATVRIDRRGRARIALRCPRRSKRRCAGALRLQRPHGPSLGRAHFSIPRARRAILMLRLHRGVPPRAAQIITRERDATGRPKLTLAPVRLQHR